MNNEEIQECIDLNYEDLRNELINKYNLFNKVRENHEPIFEPDINKQFVDMIHSFVTSYIHNRTMVDLVSVKVYVEDKFTFDNIERIISEDGRI